MKDPRQIIRKAIVTEKSSLAMENNIYVFEVDPRANKIEIKKAVETIYGVKVLSVNTVNVKGKKVRWGRIEGRRPNRKKAYCRLKEGDRIDLHKTV